MPIRAAAFAAVFYSSVCAQSSIAADADFDPDTGLRIHHYTDPVPDSVPGAVTLSTEGAYSLVTRGDVVLLDVISINDVRYDELDGSWPEFPERRHIEGSLWLPNVGFGRPAPDMLKYLIDTTKEATEGRLDQAIMVYCISDCWMGWNAVQHLARGGFSQVYWYPEGTDGWTAAGYSVVLAEPIPVSVE
jgi:PQQ-dependent catabolism-associated CXXCW motif protein